MSTSHQGARGTGYGDAAGRTEASPWVMGLAVFAGALMITAGIFQVIAGIVALFQNEIYVVGQQYAVSFDVTTWGWIHLLVGIAVALAGCAVLTGQLWGRVVGIGLAVLSMIANFMSSLLPVLGVGDHCPERLRDLGALLVRPRGSTPLIWRRVPYPGGIRGR